MALVTVTVAAFFCVAFKVSVIFFVFKIIYSYLQISGSSRPCCCWIGHGQCLSNCNFCPLCDES